MLKQAMILAAGLGTRMRELTQNQPKPLITVQGIPIIRHIIEQLLEYGIERIVINSFYKAQMLEDYIAQYAATLGQKVSIEVVREHELLETGGGVVNMLPYIKKEPFFVINGDAMWYGANVFSYLAERYDPVKSKVCLLLTGKNKTLGYRGGGDFDQNADSTLLKKQARSDYPYIYAGVHITSPGVFESRKVEKFGIMSIYQYYNDPQGEFKGIMGVDSPKIYFLHVGDKEAVAEVNSFLSSEKEEL